MGIFLRQSHNVKPRIWGSPVEVQFSIWDNLEDIYGCNHESEVLIMPLFWGFPALDYSKYGNHGTNHGATYKDGSLDFDGVDDYVRVNDSANLTLGTSNFTISVWFNSVTIPAEAYPSMIGKGDVGAGEWMFRLRRFNTEIMFFGDEGGINAESVGENYFDNAWHNAVAMRNGTSLYVYVDNELVATDTTAGSDLNDATNLMIGVANGDITRFFDGIIDEVRISNVARSADQIALFHDNPYGLYRRVVKPIWSIPAAPSIFIPQIIMF